MQDCVCHEQTTDHRQHYTSGRGKSAKGSKNSVLNGLWQEAKWEVLFLPEAQGETFWMQGSFTSQHRFWWPLPSPAQQRSAAQRTLLASSDTPHISPIYLDWSRSPRDGIRTWHTTAPSFYVGAWDIRLVSQAPEVCILPTELPPGLQLLLVGRGEAKTLPDLLFSRSDRSDQGTMQQKIVLESSELNSDPNKKESSER